ncbi:tRNA pseudouridine(13) synthase TruD [Sulfurimonas sp. HSL-3221]|uniref:tRNA pseudouridine(13) synthase TruD n=1 Tax=Sulfurimonadaceae TaxID=2771471 RepID=UPI001E359B9C|nr:tRNA pseudouridine(13) synthase TruD [Sulfurimonas sp. HSL-3221]UFS63737.1 tRNA pseudouridine(13) synthase TruD [Sulfurimonas sp. HSL-3221]
MDRFYYLQHAPIPFVFKQSVRDFVVNEIPLYPFTGNGEHLILHVRKKNLSTWDLISLLAKYLGIKGREIGYAGLKDKNAMTTQYISLPKKFEKKLEGFSHENVKILEKTYHKNKIHMGHLKGNRFFIRLKKVTPTAAKKIDEALKQIAVYGMPNFFGYQRFGIGGENWKKGEALLRGKIKERNVKLKRLYINAYQSHLFNLWLSRRIEVSTLIGNFDAKEISPLLNIPEDQLQKLAQQPHPYKLIEGDVMMHYPHGRPFEFDGDAEDIERFNERDIVPTGLLVGKRAKRSTGLSRDFEKAYDAVHEIDGQRRYAWVFPEEVEGKYREEEAWYELHFTLPKGSYATVLIEEIAKRKIDNDEEA